MTIHHSTTCPLSLVSIGSAAVGLGGHEVGSPGTAHVLTGGNPCRSLATSNGSRIDPVFSLYIDLPVSPVLGIAVVMKDLGERACM